LKSYIAGKTFDHFRPNGYDIVDSFESEADIAEVKQGLIESLVSKHVREVSIESTVGRARRKF
jgi:hypothetical protein